jgi:hypothetical protein
MRGTIALVAVVAAVGCGGKAAPVYEDRATDWYLRGISRDGRTLSITYTITGVASGCERKGHASAHELSGAVNVVAYKSVNRGANQCTEELGFIDGVVTLRSPLGSRYLVGCRGEKTPELYGDNKLCRDVSRAKGFPPFSG